jgi:DeoR family fructose operon transcriptional repressor
MTTDRRQRLALLLEKQPRGSVTELAEILALSPRTVRSDLKALGATGHVIRSGGGDGQCLAGLEAVPTTSSFADRAQTNAGAKAAIARWAAGLVQDGDTILLDASTTVYNMAPFLAARRNLVVLTNGISIGCRLAENRTNAVILVAGVIHPEHTSVVGPLYEPALRNHHIKTAFVSCRGFSLSAGLTETDVNEAAIKIRMVKLAESTAVLADSTKFGQVYQAPFARADQVTHIFSDGSLEPYWVQQVQAASIVLTLCSSA